MGIANTFNSLRPDMKDTYSDSKKKDRFKRTKKLLQGRGKATAELDASKDPMGFAKRNIEPSLKGKKGIAV